MTHVDETSSWIGFAIFLAVSYGIYIPIASFYAYKYHKNQFEMFIAKRQPKIVKIFIICAVIWLALDRPLHYLMYTLRHLQHTKSEKMVSIVIKITYPLSTLGMFLSCTTRAWLIYFNIKFNRSTQNSQWQVLINSSMKDNSSESATSTSTNFFIRHKKDYGNKRYLLKRVILPIFIVLFCFSVSEWSYVYFIDAAFVSIAAAIDGAIFLSFIMYFVVMICKTPQIYDIFNVKGEMQLLLVCVLIDYMGVLGLFYIGSGYMAAYTVAVVQAYLHSTMILLEVVVQTGFVLSNQSHNKRPNSMLTTIMSNTMERLRTISRSIGSIDERHRRPAPQMELDVSSSNSNVQFRAILANDEYFERWMDHLMDEFSTDCMISFIEFQQFQQYILEVDEFQSALLNMQHTVQSLNFYVLAACIPKSDVVCNAEQHSPLEMVPFHLYDIPSATEKNETTTDGDRHERTVNEQTRIQEVKQMAYKLYKKYIETGAEWEINISYPMRHMFESDMKDKYLWMLHKHSLYELLLLFQEVKLEMAALLGFSFSRFRTTDAFRSLIGHKH